MRQQFFLETKRTLARAIPQESPLHSSTYYVIEFTKQCLRRIQKVIGGSRDYLGTSMPKLIDKKGFAARATDR